MIVGESSRERKTRGEKVERGREGGREREREREREVTRAGCRWVEWRE